jgi:nucleoside-diphosphate-sugar epimerase
LHVEDLAGAVLHWLTQISTAGSVYELSDATPGGYDALSLANLAEKNLGRRPLVVRLPRWLLTACGYLILTAARATGRAPMLTPGKVRELTHPDWTADAAAYMRDTGWLPRLRLEDVLAPGRWFFT